MKDSVFIHHSLAYDFLTSIFRVNTNELMLRRLGRQQWVSDLKPSADMIEWIEESRRKFTLDIQEKLDLFFDPETFYGLCLLRNIASARLNSVQDFLVYIGSMSTKELLKRFLATGFGTLKVNPQDDATIERLLTDDKEALVFAVDNMPVPARQKVALLDMLSDPQQVKDDLLYLLEWYMENIYSDIAPVAERVIKNTEQEFKKEIGNQGLAFVEELSGVKYESKPRKVIVAIGYHYEFAKISAIAGETEEDIFVFGYRFSELADLQKKARVTPSPVFGALSDKTRMQIVKLLSDKDSNARELLTSLRLTNASLGESLEQLVRSGLVTIVRKADGIVYRLNKDCLHASVESLLAEIGNQ